MKGKLIAKFVHGSHLYKLNTSTSDKDYKGVYMPDLYSMYMGKIDHNIDISTNKSNEKNTGDDVDYTIYSIQKFIELLSKGEMVTFDMLFAPEESVSYYDHHGNEITPELAEQTRHPIYRLRNELCDLFVHGDMKAYLGYCKRQAAKYGIKGSRLNTLEVISDFLKTIDYGDTDRLEKLKGLLPETPHSTHDDELGHYEVLSKKHQYGVTIKSFNERIDAEINSYGKRARLAKSNEGIDWKAVSHAFRAGFQLLTMFKDGKMSIVLPEDVRGYILSVKKGELDWESEVKRSLEDLMDEVDVVSSASVFPEKPDVDKIEEEVFSMIKEWHGFNK